MVRLNQRIQIELENIDDIFTEMPSITSLPQLSKLELAELLLSYIISIMGLKIF